MLIPQIHPFAQPTSQSGPISSEHSLLGLTGLRRLRRQERDARAVVPQRQIYPSAPTEAPVDGDRALEIADARLVQVREERLECPVAKGDAVALAAIRGRLFEDDDGDVVLGEEAGGGKTG